MRTLSVERTILFTGNHMSVWKQKLKTYAEYPEVESILLTLHRAGHEAYLAGGCVRDLLLGRNSHDFDVATSAKPEDVEKLFKKTIAVGKQFGTMVVPISNQNQVEVTTFRKDLEYHDGRHPEGVVFTSAKEDAARRDFTINALFYDIKTDKIIDFVNGQKDLQDKTICAVGDPQKRFQEDKLRMLRAVRFVSQLGFEIQQNTFLAICKMSTEVLTVSKERIREELMKLLGGEYVALGLTSFRQSGMWKAIFAKAVLKEDQDFTQSLKLIQKIPSQYKEARLSCFFILDILSGNLNLQEVENILRGLKFSNQEVSYVKFLLSESQKAAKEDLRLAEIKRAFAEPQALQLKEFWLALNSEGILKLENVKLWKNLGITTSDFALPITLPEPLLSGDLLLSMGVKRGAEFGKILQEVFDLQLEEKITSLDQAQKYVAGKK